MSPFEALEAISSVVSQIFAEAWWLIVPVFLFLLFRDLWLVYVRMLFTKNITWAMLEVKIPKEILRTPKAMEQIFAVVNAIIVPSRFWEIWWKGEITQWISFEMAGTAGGVSFYIRTPEAYRNLVEASVYAQYPGAEIREVDDYTALAPRFLPNETLDLFGTNFVLAKDDAYPIRTYEYFEAPVDEQRLDSIATLTSVMAKLDEGETIWVQLLVKPPENDSWRKKTEAKVKELVGEKKLPEANPIFAVMDFFVQLIKAPFVPPTFGAPATDKPQKEPPKNLMQFLTTTQKDVVAAIEEKAGKINLISSLRFIYIDRRDKFNRLHVSGVMGAFQHLNTQHLNALRPYKLSMTTATGLFKAQRIRRKKWRLYFAYRTRRFGGKNSMMSIEELATIFHFPISVAEAPGLRRMQAKKGEPPENLPIN